MLMYYLSVLRLRITALLCGKFSSQWYFLFKKISEKYPDPRLACPEATEVNLVMALQNAISGDKTENRMGTLYPITFSFTPFGLSRKEVLYARGKPEYFGFVKVGSHNIGSLAYRSNYLEQDSMTVFYFFDEEFFCGEYLFCKKQHSLVKLLLDELRKNYRVDPPSHLSQALRITASSGTEEIYVCDTGTEISTRFISHHNPSIIGRIAIAG
jgi:hypothetical protein